MFSLPPPKKTGEGDATADNEKWPKGKRAKKVNLPEFPWTTTPQGGKPWGTRAQGKDRRGQHRKTHGKTFSPRHRGRRWVATISVHHLVVTLTSEQHTEKQVKNLIHDTRVLNLKGVWRHRRCFANKTDCLRIRRILTHHNEDRAERQEMLSRLYLPLNWREILLPLLL